VTPRQQQQQPCCLKSSHNAINCDWAHQSLIKRKRAAMTTRTCQVRSLVALNRREKAAATTRTHIASCSQSKGRAPGAPTYTPGEQKAIPAPPKKKTPTKKKREREEAEEVYEASCLDVLFDNLERDAMEHQAQQLLGLLAWQGADDLATTKHQHQCWLTMVITWCKPQPTPSTPPHTWCKDY
jgi:hypothetical protein